MLARMFARTAHATATHGRRHSSRSLVHALFRSLVHALFRLLAHESGGGPDPSQRRRGMALGSVRRDLLYRR